MSFTCILCYLPLCQLIAIDSICTLAGIQRPCLETSDVVLWGHVMMLSTGHAVACRLEPPSPLFQRNISHVWAMTMVLEDYTRSGGGVGLSIAE